MVQGSSGDGVCLVHTFADVDIAACAYLRGRRRDELRIEGGASLCCHSCLRCSCVKGRARGEIVVRYSYEHREGGALPLLINRDDLSPFAARKKVCFGPFFRRRSFCDVLEEVRFSPPLPKDPTRDRTRRHHPRGDCGNPGRYTLSVGPGAPIWSGLCGHPLTQNHGGTDTNCGAARQHFE